MQHPGQPKRGLLISAFRQATILPSVLLPSSDNACGKRGEQAHILGTRIVVCAEAFHGPCRHNDCSKWPTTSMGALSTTGTAARLTVLGLFILTCFAPPDVQPTQGQPRGTAEDGGWTAEEAKGLSRVRVTPVKGVRSSRMQSLLFAKWQIDVLTLPLA